jgi:uncharacterized protein (TIGR03382 family)
MALNDGYRAGMLGATALAALALLGAALLLPRRSVIDP